MCSLRGKKSTPQTRALGCVPPPRWLGLNCHVIPPPLKRTKGDWGRLRSRPATIVGAWGWRKWVVKTYFFVVSSFFILYARPLSCLSCLGAAPFFMSRSFGDPQRLFGSGRSDDPAQLWEEGVYARTCGTPRRADEGHGPNPGVRPERVRPGSQAAPLPRPLWTHSKPTVGVKIDEISTNSWG